MYVIKVAMGEMLVALALLTNVCALLPTRTRRAAPARISMDYMNPTASGNIGGTAVSTKSQILTESPTGKKQDFLEASPYWDQSTVPVNTWKNKAPYTAKVVSCKRIVGPEATGETCHIIFDYKGNMPYWEGQSYGVIPPGTNPKNGKPHTVRLYSIASSRYGDNMAGKTSSLCVRRATYWDPDMGKEDPAKKGVCSNFLCDSKPGDDCKMTGPSGKVMLMPAPSRFNATITVLSTMIAAQVLKNTRF